MTIDRPHGKNPWAALTVLSLGLFMTLLDITIVNVAIPQLVDSLGASLDEALWVVNAYVLALAVLLITAGRLGDIYGPRALFLLGTGIFTVASATCGLASDPALLIGARAVQGVGAALLTPQPITLVMGMFPPERRGSAFAINGVTAGVAALAGPLLGGLLVTNLSWRWIFWVNVPVGVASIVLTLLLVPDLRPGRRHRLDLVGVALATFGLFCLVFGLTEGQRYDWGTVTGFLSIPLALAVGVVVLGLFAWQQKRGQDDEPLVPFALYRNRDFTLMSLVGFALQFAIIGFFLPLTIYLQSVLGLDALQAGLVTAPSAIVSMIVARPVGRLIDRGLGKVILVFGLVTFAVGIILLDVAAQVGSARGDFIPGMVIAGLGTGCIFVPMIATAMAGVPSRWSGAASGLLNTMRQVGSAVGGAVIGAVLQNRLAAALHDQAVQRAGDVPAAARGRFVAGFDKAAGHGLEVGAGQTGTQTPKGLPAAVAQKVADTGASVFHHAYVIALHPTLAISAVLLLVAAVCALASRDRRRGRDKAPTADPAPAEAKV
jgi:EmrB/QacA subfamily drug resistance transporter